MLAVGWLHTHKKRKRALWPWHFTNFARHPYIFTMSALHSRHGGFFRSALVLAELGSHLLPWQVELHNPSPGRRRRVAGRGSGGTIALHGEELAGPWRDRFRKFRFRTGGARRAGGRCGAELHSCGVLQCVLTCFNLECRSPCQPTPSHHPQAPATHLGPP